MQRFLGGFVSLCENALQPRVLALEFLNFTVLTPRHEGTKKTCSDFLVALCLCVRTLCGFAFEF